MAGEFKSNIREPDTWIRLLYVILFAVIYTVGEIVITAIVVLQFGFVLISGAPNENLLRFGDAATRYMFDVLRYFTFNSDEKPFPFADWPRPIAEPASEGPEVVTGASRAESGPEPELEQDATDDSSEKAGEADSVASTAATKKKTTRRKRAATRRPAKKAPD